MSEDRVTLTVKKNATEKIKTHVLAAIRPVSQTAFHAAGQQGIKASFVAEVWAHEYAGQTGIVYRGREYAIYRTYGTKNNGKVELYAAEKVGKN